MDSEPPFLQSYKTLFKDLSKQENNTQDVSFNSQIQLPVIDLDCLRESSQKECFIREIGEVAKEWGFFQVVNHGISNDILKRMREVQEKMLREPFNDKANRDDQLTKGCYRWGSPTATSIMQFSWSEAFHIPLSHISGLSSTIEEFAEKLSKLAQMIAAILADNLGKDSTFFVENCLPSSSYLRLNRYPICPFSHQVHGLVPHTDSDFLTILYQDSVGGLQIIKDGKWIGVKPNPDALIINIGDLFQAWSNGVYKSIQHRVIPNGEKERYSIAYFMCPSYDSVIQNSGQFPSLYKRFTFREYRQKVEEDVKTTGSKMGLQGFLA